MAMLCVFVFVGTAVATDYTFKEQVIKVEQKKDYLEITVVNKQLKEPIVYRIYPCGEVQMQEWKQLAPNKEPAQSRLFSGTTLSLPNNYAVEFIGNTDVVTTLPVVTGTNKLVW
jgi:hypothetical protein